MELYVLGVSYSAEATTYEPVAVIDTFKSLIWTKRFFTYGDFELYLPADEKLLTYLKPRNWLIRDDDTSVMIIENITIETNIENGDYFIVSGRSLESILGYRVIIPQITINESDAVQAIKTLIIENTSSNRVFPSMTIDDSLQVPDTISTQFTGQNLLSVISDICMKYGFGIKMELSSGGFTLSFYEGVEGEVIFSPEFDNLVNSKYVSDLSNYASYAYIAGEGEGTNRKINNTYFGNMKSGFARREIFVDAKDISSNDGEIPLNDYMQLLQARGVEKLAEHQATKAFEAEIESTINFAYKQDWNLGDIVTITNEYGITATPRIVEIIESWDDNGYSVIPTLEELEV